jgi:hypothetical protein
MRSVSNEHAVRRVLDARVRSQKYEWTRSKFASRETTAGRPCARWHGTASATCSMVSTVSTAEASRPEIPLAQNQGNQDFESSPVPWWVALAWLWLVAFGILYLLKSLLR